MWPGLILSGYCLVSLHFMWRIMWPNRVFDEARASSCVKALGDPFPFLNPLRMSYVYVPFLSSSSKEPRAWNMPLREVRHLQCYEVSWSHSFRCFSPHSSCSLK